MEIHATVYAVARDKDELRHVAGLLRRMTGPTNFIPDALEPCAALPLKRGWAGFVMRVEPADKPDDWMRSLERCGAYLMEDGFVIVVFNSPDHDSYQEYAYTTPDGEAEQDDEALPLYIYDDAQGNEDLSLAFNELITGRTARDRFFASRRSEKKEAARKEKGDFDITLEGVLTKYRGIDTDLVIPEGVREIGKSAFVDLKGVERMIMDFEDYDAPPLVTLTIPKGVEKIGTYAFAYCLNLEEVKMANSVKLLGDRAFEGCDSLRKIRLSSGLIEIEEYTFFLCENLTSVTIPEGVTRIGKGAFSSCGSLKKVTLPRTLKSIGDEAFEGTALTNIAIPDSVEEIGKDAFPEGCARQ